MILFRARTNLWLYVGQLFVQVVPGMFRSVVLQIEHIGDCRWNLFLYVVVPFYTPQTDRICLSVWIIRLISGFRAPGGGPVCFVVTTVKYPQGGTFVLKSSVNDLCSRHMFIFLMCRNNQNFLLVSQAIMMIVGTDFMVLTKQFLVLDCELWFVI